MHFDISSTPRLTESRITTTKERLLEATRHRKHAKPAGLYSKAKQTQNFNKDRVMSDSLPGDDMWGVTRNADSSNMISEPT